MINGYVMSINAYYNIKDAIAVDYFAWDSCCPTTLTEKWVNIYVKKCFKK